MHRLTAHAKTTTTEHRTFAADFAPLGDKPRARKDLVASAVQAKQCLSLTGHVFQMALIRSPQPRIDYICADNDPLGSNNIETR